MPLRVGQILTRTEQAMDKSPTVNVIPEKSIPGDSPPLERSDFQTLFDRAPIGIFRTTSAGQVRYVNACMAAMVGAASPQEAMARFSDLSKQLYADPARRRDFVRQISRNGEVQGFEYEAVRLDGEHRWLSMSARISERCPDGTVVIDGFTVDITEIKAMEKALRESEQRFRSAFDNSSFGRTMTLPDGRLNRVNKALCEMLGRDARTLANMKIADITHPDDLAGSLALVQQMLDGQSAVRRTQKRYVHADGRMVWGDVSVILIRDEAGQPVHFLTEMVDITEQKQAEQKNIELERQLNHAQKMEAVGRLAGGVAHDFNNLLSIILGYAETMLEELPEGHPLGESLKEISDAGGRAKQLTRQLLAFSRKQTLELVHIDVNAVVTGFEKLLRRVIGEDIDLKLTLSSTALLVKADVSRIEQVLMNLAVNARDAMPRGGCLTIETAMVRSPQSLGMATLPSASGPYARIVVSDTGMGMDRETLQRVFEPFFTTKGKDQGTGLGLATSYGIVHQHGGSIEVHSAPGKGARFTILLPLSDAGPAQKGHGSEARAPHAVAATILVVEDDPSVRKLAVSILRKKGYRILEPADVHDAVALASDPTVPIDLLLTDVVMPGMMGPEVYAKVAAYHPNLRVLYMSGHTYNVLSQHGIPEDEAHLIQKPFSVKGLVDKVHAVLQAF